LLRPDSLQRVADKEGLAAEISRELGLPVFPASRGGTITRPFLEAVAVALGVDSRGSDKVQLTKLLVKQVGQRWDAACSSAHTGSGGGGNITAVALRRLLVGIRQRDREPLGEPVGEHTTGSAWSDQYAAVADELELEGRLEPTSLDDERRRTFSAIAQRRGESRFRRQLIEAYGKRCAMTECDVEEALEVARLVPYLGSRSNLLSNAIPLRADVHTLFDLALIGIHPESRRILVSGRLKGSEYELLGQQTIAEPRDPAARPTASVLLWRAETIGLPD
jgi:hypothetical protein